jgi:hypothetical protein
MQCNTDLIFLSTVFLVLGKVVYILRVVRLAKPLMATNAAQARSGQVRPAAQATQAKAVAQPSGSAGEGSDACKLQRWQQLRQRQSGACEGSRSII